MKPEHCGVVILAAGRSERMKEYKALLPFDAKETFIERIVSTFSTWGCGEIVLVTNPETQKEMEKLELIPREVKVVINHNLELERFYSVKLGLGAILNSRYCFIQNIDNPFVDSSVLDLLYQNRSEKAYVSPVFNHKKGHPVLLNRHGIRTISEWTDHAANLKEVLGIMECRTVEMPDDRVLININDPKEYQRYFLPTPHSEGFIENKRWN